MSVHSWWACWCTYNVRCAVCFLLVLIAFIFDVIGYAVPYWYSFTVSATTTKFFGGLWKTCTENAGVMTCVNNVGSNVEGWFKANQALQSIGMILLFAAVIILFVLVVFCKGHVHLKISAIVILIASAVFILIGVVIYGVAIEDQNGTNLDFGFAFVVVAAIIAIFCSICLCIGIHDNWKVDPMEMS